MNFKPNNSIHNWFYLYYMMYSCMYSGFDPEINLFVFNTIQYNTIELYCPVNGKFVCSVRVKVNKNTIVIKKIRINKYIQNEHLNFYQHN